MDTGSCKKKSQNFTAAEHAVFIQEVEEKRDMLLSKFSQNITHDRKRRAWEEITAKVNAVNIGEPRTVQQVKKKWQDLFSRTKKKEAERRKELRKTGGGQCVPPLNEVEEKVLSMVSDVSVEGIAGGLDSMEPVGIADATMDLTDIPDEAENNPRRSLFKAPVSTMSLSERMVELEERRLKIEEERLQMEKERLKREDNIFTMLSEIHNLTLESVAVQKERLRVDFERCELEKSRSIFPVPVFVDAENSK